MRFKILNFYENINAIVENLFSAFTFSDPEYRMNYTLIPEL
jgi:hypothetical protein